MNLLYNRVKHHLNLFGYAIIRNQYKSKFLYSIYSALGDVHKGVG